MTWTLARVLTCMFVGSVLGAFIVGVKWFYRVVGGVKDSIE